MLEPSNDRVQRPSWRLGAKKEVQEVFHESTADSVTVSAINEQLQRHFLQSVRSRQYPGWIRINARDNPSPSG